MLSDTNGVGQKRKQHVEPETTSRAGKKKKKKKPSGGLCISNRERFHFQTHYYLKKEA